MATSVQKTFKNFIYQKSTMSAQAAQGGQTRTDSQKCPRSNLMLSDKTGMSGRLSYAGCSLKNVIIGAGANVAVFGTAQSMNQVNRRVA